MISEAHGDLLEAEVDALVNTVNTVGVMGKGLAPQFKRACPAMFSDYQRAAKRGDVRLGRMHVWPVDGLDGPRFIINFPTKGHWKGRSRLGDIERGLDDLVSVIQVHGITSVAVPPLGCRNGGLAWRDVEPVIRRYLEPLADVDIRLYGPEGPPPAAEMPDATSRPPLTTSGTP